MGIFRDTKKDIVRRDYWLETFDKEINKCDTNCVLTAFLQGSDIESHYRSHGISYETKEKYKEKVYESINKFEKNCVCNKK